MAIALKELLQAERIATGCSHMLRVLATDLAAAALAAGSTTSHVLTVKTYIARDIFDRCYFEMPTGFVGASVTNLTAKIGHNGASVDDDDSLLAATELATAGTEILASAGTGTRFAAQEAGNIELTFTSTGANISVLTSGEVIFYLNCVRLPDLRGINGPVNA